MQPIKVPSSAKAEPRARPKAYPAKPLTTCRGRPMPVARATKPTNKISPLKPWPMMWVSTQSGVSALDRSAASHAYRPSASVSMMKTPRKIVDGFMGARLRLLRFRLVYGGNCGL